MAKEYSVLLPLLKPTHDVTAFQNSGTWETRNATELEKISDGLDVKVPDSGYTGIDSIPNMWARPLLFEMALYDTHHPMHEHILGEWRGLLAMLALKERRNFPVSVEQIEISDTGTTDAPEFLLALRRLLPKDALDKQNTSWDILHLILFNGKPIGLTSPTTLVCTSVNYVDYIVDVPWYDKCLRDPISDLNQEEKAAVVGWLQNLNTQIDLGTNPNIDSTLSGRLRTLIRDFRSDLGVDPQENIDFSDRSLGLTQGIFRCMDRPIAGKEYFTDKLFVIQQENALCGTSKHQIHPSTFSSKDSLVDPNGNFVTPILPIKDNLLADLNISDLNQRISFEQLKDGIKVSLQVPLSNTDEENEELETSREYKYVSDTGRDLLFKNWEIVEIPALPILEIWPNFKAPNWKVYYTYFSRGRGDDTFYAKPLPTANEQGNDSRQLLESTTGNIEKEITKTSHFPEVMLCQYKASGSSKLEDAGVLLIPSPESPIIDGSIWTVGIDFGTTSTAVYKNDGNNKPSRIEFGERLLKVTDSDDTDRASLYDYFFPPNPEQTPFFSLFHIWNNNQSSQQTLNPLLDGHIYFLTDYQKFNDENTIGRIFSNLKWSSDTADRIRTRAFLEQLCLQCAAEAVAAGAEAIKWRFSFPMAFSVRDKTDFKDIWQTVTDACTEEAGLQNEGVSSEPESIVTAKYFANPDFTGTFAPGAVCIDIGGATSDISIWQNNVLCSQTSLRFAGRDMFLNLLTANPTFLQHFEVDETVTDGLQSTLRNEFERYAIVDALLESAGEAWLELFSNSKRQFPVNEFSQLIAMGVSGLLYYVGLLIKHLIRDKLFSFSQICVYIGGKGSRILKWFGDNELDMKLLKQVFLDASGFNIDLPFRIVISDRPKEEAAFGLVSDTMDLHWKEEDHEDLVLAGESFTVQGKHFEWNSVLTPELIETDLMPTSNLIQTQNFVDSFNKLAGPEADKVLQILIEMDESDYTDSNYLRGNLMDELKRIQAEDPQQRRIEPLFILALKNLLKNKTDEWQKKTNNKL